MDEENTIVCVANNKIFRADVGQSGKICGRKLRLGETPRRLLYYKPLGIFIVACMKIPREEYQRGGGGELKSWCSLKAIDPKTFVTTNPTQ